MLPSAHQSPQPIGHLDRFSHFRTAHGRMSSGMAGHVLSPKNCPFAWVSEPPSNTCTCFPWPTRVRNSNGILIGSAVLQSVVGNVGACPSPQNSPSPWELGTPSNTWFLEPARALSPNGISIGSAIFAQVIADCRRACLVVFFALKIAPSYGDLDPI